MHVGMLVDRMAWLGGKVDAAETRLQEAMRDVSTQQVASHVEVAMAYAEAPKTLVRH